MTFSGETHALVVRAEFEKPFAALPAQPQIGLKVILFERVVAAIAARIGAVGEDIERQRPLAVRDGGVKAARLVGFAGDSGAAGGTGAARLFRDDVDRAPHRARPPQNPPRPPGGLPCPRAPPPGGAGN